jgi:hypothetical protein
MSQSMRRVILLGLLIAGFSGLLLIEPIAQDPDYHLFADQRGLFGIPNFNDTLSNLGFALAGIIGLSLVATGRRHEVFVQAADSRPYIVFFVAVALISIGSAFYHLAPSNDRLFWDRLPMSIAFMAFVSSVVADRIHRRAGNGWMLILLVVLGVLSLVYWIATESLGAGDLRFYAFVQFFPILLLPVVIWLFPAYRYTMTRYLGWVITWYALSKVFEYYDAEIFTLTGEWISGHSLKHIAAAVGAYVVLKMLFAAQHK